MLFTCFLKRGDVATAGRVLMMVANGGAGELPSIDGIADLLNARDDDETDDDDDDDNDDDDDDNDDDDDDEEEPMVVELLEDGDSASGAA